MQPTQEDEKGRLWKAPAPSLTPCQSEVTLRSLWCARLSLTLSHKCYLFFLFAMSPLRCIDRVRSIYSISFNIYRVIFLVSYKIYTKFRKIDWFVWKLLLFKIFTKNTWKVTRNEAWKSNYSKSLHLKFLILLSMIIKKKNWAKFTNFSTKNPQIYEIFPFGQ